MTVQTPAPARRSREGGFTLLELLIAMTLLGLIFAAITGGLRFGTQAWRAGAERLADGEDLQLVHRTMRRQLASAIRMPETSGITRQDGTFEGERDRMSFVATAPARSMAPGLYRISVFLVPDAGHHALALGWRRMGQSANTDALEGMEPLLRGAQSIELSYFGAPEGDEAPRWTERWPEDSAAPPRLVRIRVIHADPTWPPWPAMILTVGAGSG